ncbi:SH3 domain-containing protein [Aggregatilinea lenta]|uniref:SH3 domain-containing protein n=1 Tax=Aggregatilinea lenta TaxID=913108 RepID=UPI0013C375D0|nr:SH3 domain-containing protein [Aggregatilinea lenta]
MTRIRFLLTLTFVVVLAVAAVGAQPWTVRAQGDGTLPYNEPVIISLTAGQSLTRTFSAQAGDSLALTVAHLTDFSFSAVLIDPQQTATLLPPGPDGNISASFDALAAGGVYQLVIQSSGAGDLLILLNGSPVEPTPLALGDTVVDLGAGALHFSLTPPDGVPSTYLAIVPVTEDPAAPASLPALRLVNSGQGTTALSVEAGMLNQLAIVLPVPTVFVLSLDPGVAPQQLMITWDVTNGIVPPGGVPNQTPGSSSGACAVNFAGGVNVRTGPSMFHTIRGIAAPGSTLPVTGRTADTSWWQVTFDGAPGWVASGLATVQTSGDCSAVPVADAPPAPPTAVPSASGAETGSPTTDTTTTVTATPTTDTSATATWTPTITPSWSATWTWTPTETLTATWTWTPTWTLTATWTWTPTWTPTP